MNNIGPIGTIGTIGTIGFITYTTISPYKNKYTEIINHQFNHAAKTGDLSKLLV